MSSVWGGVRVRTTGTIRCPLFNLTRIPREFPIIRGFFHTLADAQAEADRQLNPGIGDCPPRNKPHRVEVVPAVEMESTGVHSVGYRARSLLLRHAGRASFGIKMEGCTAALTPS